MERTNPPTREEVESGMAFWLLKSDEETRLVQLFVDPKGGDPWAVMPFIGSPTRMGIKYLEGHGFTWVAVSNPVRLAEDAESLRAEVARITAALADSQGDYDADNEDRCIAINERDEARRAAVSYASAIGGEDGACPECDEDWPDHAPDCQVGAWAREFAEIDAGTAFDERRSMDSNGSISR